MHHEETRVIVADGKYTVCHTNGQNLRALRYDQPWRDLVGDNLIYCLVSELQQAREQLAAEKKDHADSKQQWNEAIDTGNVMVDDVERLCAERAGLVAALRNKVIPDIAGEIDSVICHQYRAHPGCWLADINAILEKHLLKLAPPALSGLPAASNHDEK